MGQGRYPTAAEKTARHTRQEYNRRCGLLDPQPAAPRLVFSRRVANLLPVCSHATHRKKRCSRHMQTFFSRGSGDAALDLGTWLLAFWQAQSRDGSDRLRGAHLCGVARPKPKSGQLPNLRNLGPARPHSQPHKPTDRPGRTRETLDKNTPNTPPDHGPSPRPIRESPVPAIDEFYHPSWRTGDSALLGGPSGTPQRHPQTTQPQAPL